MKKFGKAKLLPLLTVAVIIFLAACVNNDELNNAPFGGRTVISMAAGDFHSLALTDDGVLWAWGNSASSGSGIFWPVNFWELDCDHPIRWPAPDPLGMPSPAYDCEYCIAKANRINAELTAYDAFPTPILEDVVKIASSFAITSDGVLWGWGSNTFRQLTGSVESRMFGGQPYPVPIKENVISVAAGGMHTMAITADGNLWSWGNNNSGQLGCGLVREYGERRPLSRSQPRVIMENVTYVTTSINASLAITECGTLWKWGTGSRDYTPTRFMQNVIHASAGSAHNLAITSDGILWGWGRNDRQPTKIMEDVIFAEAANISLIIKYDNTLWSMGCATSISRGNFRYIAQYNLILIMEDVVKVVGSSSHAMAITSDGNLWAWGNNSHGQLGDGTRDYKEEPVLVGRRLR